MAVLDEKWQKTKASITERGIFMFNNELLSDVSLVVRSSSDEGEPKKSKMAIPAHKFVLSSCSPVFFAMFCGQLAEKSDSVVLPDCEYEGVMEMLRYMYSGEAKLNENNVMQVLYVAKKYILPSLADECVRFLRRHLNTENVFCVLSHAQQYDEKDLEGQCWEVIDRETEGVVKSEGFATIERSLLEGVVKRDTLTIREIELFKAVDLWATKECERQGLTLDSNVKRKVLGEETVKEIRFPVMEVKEFASIVPGCKILTPEEVIDIMKYMNSVVSSPIGFPEKRRVGTGLICFRFDDVDYISVDEDDGWEYDSDVKECIDFQVDKYIDLYGVRMLGSENNDYTVILKIRDTELNRLVASKSGKFSSVRMQTGLVRYYGFDILFDSPIVVRKDARYCVKAIIDGPDSCFGFDGCGLVQSDGGVTFTFLDCKEKDCGPTDVERGQFAAFLYRPHRFNDLLLV
ncbi:BTB/POZ domain-containing protein 6-B-like [Oculina patagonica]